MNGFKYRLDYTNRLTLKEGLYVMPIIAEQDFADVKVGDVGGYVQNYSNLEQNGTCWAYPGTILLGNTHLSGHAVAYSTEYKPEDIESYCILFDTQASGWARIGDSDLLNSELQGVSAAVGSHLDHVSLLDSCTVKASVLKNISGISSFVENVLCTDGYPKIRDVNKKPFGIDMLSIHLRQQNLGLGV